MDERLKEHDARLKVLESFRQDSITKHAVDLERQKSINTSIDRVAERLDKLDSNFGKIFWIIGGIVVAAIANWMLSGGLGAA